MQLKCVFTGFKNRHYICELNICKLAHLCALGVCEKIGKPLNEFMGIILSLELLQ